MAVLGVLYHSRAYFRSTLSSGFMKLALAGFAFQAAARPSLALQLHHHRTHSSVHVGPPYESIFLNQVEQTVERVLKNYKESDDILALPPDKREAVGIARHLRKRIASLTRNKDCRRCWLQQKHCFCDQCPPLQPPPCVKRLFIVMHHKEICLAVDTSRLLLSSFPDTCRLVVGGIGPEYQASMAELQNTMKGNKCIVLFPSDEATTFEQLERQASNDDYENESFADDGWDVIVIDGTWSQARKLFARYIPLEANGGPSRVQLSEEALVRLSARRESGDNDNEASQIPGHQLRRHPIQWKAISTLEATRLLFNDMVSVGEGRDESFPWDKLSTYQQIADAATKTQLGPHR